MKSRVMGMLLMIMLMVSGCAQNNGNEPQKPPAENEQQKPEEGKPEPPAQEGGEEKTISLYYMEESTGEIASKEVSVKGDISEAVLERLKEAQVLSAACAVEDISVKEKTIEVAVNQAFGDYIRGMGSGSSEQIVECFARTYLQAYNCEWLKITENGNPFDTGHTVLEGYIHYE